MPFSRKAIDPRPDMISEAVTDEVIWDCTTCRACMEACPVYIEHVDKIVDMRRNLAMERSRVPRVRPGGPARAWAREAIPTAAPRPPGPTGRTGWA